MFAALSMPAVSAATLTPEQALARLQGESDARKAPARASLVYTEMIDSSPALYLFAKGGEGFMLLPADDSTVPLLGYSDEGTLPASAAEFPPSFRYWMEYLARQVKLNAESGASVSDPVPVGDEIEPMTTTRWNQLLPYSYDCPEADGRHLYTGCVATALAQIMKYHNYPERGTGSHSYTWKNPVTEKDTVLSFDYASTTLKWDIMKDRYERDDPWDSKAAVAELMYACGVAVDMWYGLDGSGAATTSVAPAMIEYFGYDKGIRNYIRDYYESAEWDQLVYDQLRQYGPVQYSGFGKDDGHSFIVDGYSKDGYFHLNWGWGGMSDGYYLLSALDPLDKGPGGAAQAFDYSQDFVGNVTPEHTSSEIYPLILMSGNFGVSETTLKTGDDVAVEGSAFSYSAGLIHHVMFGAMLIPEAGGDTIYLDGPTFGQLGINHGVGRYDVHIPADLPDGTYTMKPAYRDGNRKWYAMPVKTDKTSSLTLKCSDGKITISSDVPTSVSMTPSGEPVKTEYIGLDGVSLGDRPASSGFYIEKTTYSDGSVTAKMKAK